ncbi:coiled-coil-helix-coiled-coil-helix domain-containing protein 1 [Cimex lectularius]|uniref:Coiled-coil-helix-coiled-coil-helix domain-containing protein 1 n=1 Tax=Cimex lectularius TaxID=79782 RepID=A0A8I6RUV1_CIMLE|nr:coiled-coil-helix-coiled-coil-helix domain-containing protein 1 [Cimex lectularius]
MSGRSKLSGYVRRGGYITEDRVPLQILMPLKLKQSVSGKSASDSGVACIQEMSVMFACLKSNNFSESRCPKEIASFQKCCTENAQAKKHRKEMERKGILNPGEKNLSHKQVGQLLKKFP